MLLLIYFKKKKVGRQMGAEDQNKSWERLASLITWRRFTSTAGGSPDFLKMTGSTMAKCSVSTSFSQSQVNDSVTTAELMREKREMSGGRNRDGEGRRKRRRGRYSLRLSLEPH